MSPLSQFQIFGLQRRMRAKGSRARQFVSLGPGYISYHLAYTPLPYVARQDGQHAHVLVDQHAGGKGRLTSILVSIWVLRIRSMISRRVSLASTSLHLVRLSHLLHCTFTQQSWPLLHRPKRQRSLDPLWLKLSQSAKHQSSDSSFSNRPWLLSLKRDLRLNPTFKSFQHLAAVHPPPRRHVSSHRALVCSRLETVNLLTGISGSGRRLLRAVPF